MVRVYLLLPAIAISACDRASEPTIAPMDAASPPVARPSLAPTASPAASAAPSFAPPDAREGRACELARSALAEFEGTFPTKCHADADCDGYYVGATACDAALILAKPGVPPSLEGHLAELQATVRASCRSPANACSPRPFRARCNGGRCADDVGSN